MLYARRPRTWLFAATLLLVCFLSLHLGAPTARAAEPALQCATSATHVVRAGETLSGIAAQYGVSVAAIVQASGLADANTIYAGQSLSIPACEGAPAAAPPAAAAPAAPGTDVIHVVQPGETLSGIATRYGVSADALAQVNRLANPNAIIAGQRLVIPSGDSAAPAPAPPPAPRTAGGGKRIEVDLTRQWMYAYEGDRLILSSGVSTGKPGWETPAGTFAVYAKLPLQTMSGNVNGESWYVPDVPNVMYFYRSVALHGTYWHNRFGTGERLSHGCVNLPLDVAAQLYNWAPIGTPVVVYY